jgi:4-hydroxy-3-methylbut-2-enyl diphosphate reductase
MKNFEIPGFYRSSIISRIKKYRQLTDPRKKDLSPTVLEFHPFRFLIARHFGFCYGVENAIDIAYKTVEENSGKRIFLLSEMIHNPLVNLDLQSRGVQFIMDTIGNQLIDWDNINCDDIVIIPAFGTTLEIEKLLKEKNIDTVSCNTTCPFVEKVWNRAKSLGEDNYTVIIHGKASHEETRATFSHSIINAPSLILRDIEEVKILSKIILNEINGDEFYKYFKGKYSEGFNIAESLNMIGVVNQTTMLASETQAIADYLKETMIRKFGNDNLKEHFADTRDTLCYATYDNQSATIQLKQENADFAIVIGGYNSSNTSHLVELLNNKFTTYFISDADKIINRNMISSFNIHSHSEIITENFLPEADRITIAVTSGSSCPDAVVDDVLLKLLSFSNITDIEEVLKRMSI